MAGFTCPYCGMVMAITNSTHKKRFPSFNKDAGHVFTGVDHYTEPDAVEMGFYKCPNCGKITITAKGIGSAVSDVNTTLRPASMAKRFPSYIPRQIREDYEEAYAIVRLSPKASATLARRCLQGMIRDFWNLSRGNLHDEISALKGSIQPDLWQAIDDLRQLGNIGAHMQKKTNLIVDIDPGEAEKLICLIELLMKEWYINRHDRDKLLDDIRQINTQKQAAKKGRG